MPRQSSRPPLAELEAIFSALPRTATKAMKLAEAVAIEHPDRYLQLQEAVNLIKRAYFLAGPVLLDLHTVASSPAPSVPVPSPVPSTRRTRGEAA